MKERIIAKITEKLEVKYLEVINNSHLHKGHIKKMIPHSNSSNNQESQLKIIINSSDLNSLSLIKAHRYVNLILKEEFQLGLHALEIKIVKINPNPGLVRDYGVILMTDLG
jgi:BolA protein